MTFTDDIRRSTQVRDARRGALPALTGCAFRQDDVPGRPCCVLCCHLMHGDAPRVLRKKDDPCTGCMQNRLHIAAVITAWNEGDEVARTVESLRASVSDAVDLTIILVDDGSTDGSCTDAGADLVLRQDMSHGVGVSRNLGHSCAVYHRAHVVSFHDAHMRFPVGGLERLARRAVQTRSIVCSGTNGLESERRHWGCDLFWNRWIGLQPLWQVHETPADEWLRCACPMGAGYVMDMRTAEQLFAATGDLWDDVVGRWGFSEQALAVKAFLLGIPVEFSRDVVIRHLYKDTNPVQNASREVRRNATYSMARILGREMFDVRFRPWCEKGLSKGEVSLLVAQACRCEPVAQAYLRERIWTHLVGKFAPVTHQHPAQSWLGRVDDAIRDLGERFPQGKGARILQWRPGEATMRIWRELPEAELHAVERPGHRHDNWYDLFAAHRQKLRVCEPGKNYPRPPAQGYDLALIGGEMQDLCEAAARGALRQGGRLLLNPQADDALIADQFLKKEGKEDA
jgi:glycosyltransferase involved in cell wall biosynthesis